MRIHFLGGLIAGMMCAALSCATPAAAAQIESLHGAAIQQVANVCGANGCAPVQTKRYTRPPKPGAVAAHHI